MGKIGFRVWGYSGNHGKSKGKKDGHLNKS